MAASTSIPDDEFGCQFCEYVAPSTEQMESHLIGEHAEEIAERHWGRHVATQGTPAGAKRP